MRNKEDLELIKFFEWVRWQSLKDSRLKTIFHIANERKTTPRAGYFLKRKGVISGVPDVFVPISCHGLHGLFIEFKIKPNKLTKNQKLVAQSLIDNGFGFFIAYSADEAISTLARYICL